MSKRLNIFLGGAAICLAIVMIAACAPATPKTETTTTKITTTPATTTTTTSGKIVPKGSAIVALSMLGAQPTVPSYLTGSPEYPMIYAMNSQLCYSDPITAKITPNLAESWKMESDLLTWTFTLRKGLKFHSGNPITANDYVVAYQRYKDGKGNPASISTTLGLFASVTAVNDYTFQAKTTSPFATMIINQAQGGPRQVPYPVDSKYLQQVGEDEFLKHPSLSGPFKFVDQVKGDYTKLEGFADAYQPPYTQYLTYKIVPEATTRLALLKTGEADVMTDVSGPTIPEAKAAQGLRVVSSPEADVLDIIISDYLFPNEPSPLLDKRVRQALAYAIDRKTMISKLYFGEGTEVACPSVTPWHLGYNPNIKGYSYDPVKAKALLKDAGYPNGFSYTLTARPIHMEAATAVAGYWRDLGLDIKLVSIDPAVYLTEATAKKLRGSWITTVPTIPADFAIHLQEYYQKDQMWAWCQSDTYTAKVQDVLATMDEAQRIEKMKALSLQISEELPSRLPLIARNCVYAIGPKVAELIPGKVSYWCYPQLLKMK